MTIGFEVIWKHRLPSGQERDLLPTAAAAGADDRQVLVPHGDHRDAPAVSLDELADKPWVESVVAEWPCTASVALPGVRSLISLHADRTTRQLLDRLPNLEQLVAHDVIPDDLAGLPRLRDAIFDWKGFDVPLGVNVQRMLDHPEEREPYRRATEGSLALARLTGLERLGISRFLYRDRADPIGELTKLRWLSLHGWRNLRVLGRLTQLERLELIDVEMANLRAFRRLSRLRQLRLMGRMKSLDGIEALQTLEDIWLRGRVVRDLKALAALPGLRLLELVYPDAVEDFAPLGRLVGLRRLSILVGDNTGAGELPSIEFLAGLERLEHLELLNANILDHRLDPLFELPSLRFVWLTGRAGPNVDELRRRRPDIEVKVHLVGEPEGRVYVGPVHYDPPAPGIEQWSVFQSLAELLETETNHAAESLIRSELRRREPQLVQRLEFDSEAGGVGIYARTENDIRRVAEIIAELAGADS